MPLDRLRKNPRPAFGRYLLRLFLAFVVLDVAIGLVFSVPFVEARLFPVAKVETVPDSVTRQAGTVCWTSRFEKLRRGLPLFFEYKIEHEGRVIPEPTYKDLGSTRIYLSTAGFADHKPGERWESTYCMNYPNDIRDWDTFVIRGISSYRVPHGLWKIENSLPTISVGPVQPEALP